MSFNITIKDLLIVMKGCEIMSTNKHVYQIIGNDPFNIKILNETLWDIKERLFYNLYEAQKAITDIRRFDFTMDDFDVFNNTEVIYSINSQFITNETRIAYRNSPFYKKNISPDDIISNTDIFYNSVMVFINGELYTNYYVRPNEDITNIVFKSFASFPTTSPYVRNGFTHKELKDLIDSKAVMTVFFVNNHEESVYKTNLTTLTNYAVNPQYLGLPIVNFASLNDIDHSDDFTCWVTNDDTHLYKYQLLTTELKDDKIYFNENEIKSLSNTYTYLKNVYLLNYMDTITVPTGTEYFELPIKDMPIPIENLLIFRKNNCKLLFDHSTKLSLYYPNIYKVETTHKDDLVIFVYYSDDTVSVGSKYKNELRLYYRFVNNVLERYKNKTIPDIIKNYTPISMVYDNNDLQKSFSDHLIYKMNRLTESLNLEGDYYAIYLDKLVGYMPSFYIDVSEIENLSSRYRTNNHQEIKDPAQKEEFSEPCYLFLFRHNSINDKVNIIIDGYQSNETYEYYDEKYTYIYIPARMVNTDSMIHVEKFVDYNYRQEITISDINEYYKINIPNYQRIQMSDIYISTQDNDGNAIYMTKNDYTLYRKIDDIYEEITDNDFFSYKEVYVKFNNPIDANKVVNAYVTRITFKQVIKGKNEFNINIPINNDSRNILIYKNGRLVPNVARKYTFSDKIKGPHRIKALLNFNPEDEFTFIYNTNKYFMVYYQETINKKGIVDLTGKISKPLDFKWYDIYLNGIKLDETNTEIISPFIMIITGIPTLTNLEVYQKNLDSYTWDNTYDTDDISSRIFDEIVDEIEDQYDDIDDIIPDITLDIVVDIIGFLEEYLFSLKLINPDLQQITTEMKSKYFRLFDSKNNLYVNPDFDTTKFEMDVFLNPDKGTFTTD